MSGVERLTLSILPVLLFHSYFICDSFVNQIPYHTCWSVFRMLNYRYITDDVLKKNYVISGKLYQRVWATILHQSPCIFYIRVSYTVPYSICSNVPVKRTRKSSYPISIYYVHVWYAYSINQCQTRKEGKMSLEMVIGCLCIDTDRYRTLLAGVRVEFDGW